MKYAGSHLCRNVRCQISDKKQEQAWGVNVNWGKSLWLRLVCFLFKNLSSSGNASCCVLTLSSLGSDFCYQTFLYYFLSSPIEIRCSEYITVTSCCQHWFSLFPEIWCWNPLQADKYLSTWLPDLIAFCTGGCIGVTRNACHTTLYSSSVMPCDAPPRRSLI